MADQQEDRGAREPEVVVADRVEIKDSEGRVRAVLGETAGGGFGLRFLDPGGSERLVVGFLEGGPTVSFAAWGETLAELGVIDETPEPYARLVILDPRGEPLAYLPGD